MTARDHKSFGGFRRASPARPPDTRGSELDGLASCPVIILIDRGAIRRVAIGIWWRADRGLLVLGLSVSGFAGPRPGCRARPTGPGPDRAS